MKCKILGVFALVISLSACDWGFQHYLEEGQEKYDAGDYAGAYEKWYVLAQQGNLDAKRKIGVMCYIGLVAQCGEEGKGWLEYAADQGDVEAQEIFAILHDFENIDYFGINERQKRRLFRILYADQEEGMPVFDGESFSEAGKKNYQEVFRYASLAAEQGSAIGYVILGGM